MKDFYKLFNGGPGSGVKGHVTPKQLSEAADRASQEANSYPGEPDLHGIAAKAHQAAAESHKRAQADNLQSGNYDPKDQQAHYEAVVKHEGAAKEHGHLEFQARAKNAPGFLGKSNKPWWGGDKHLD